MRGLPICFVGVYVIRLPGGESAKNIMAGATGKRFLRKPVTGTAA